MLFLTFTSPLLVRKGGLPQEIQNHKVSCNEDWSSGLSALNGNNFRPWPHRKIRIISLYWRDYNFSFGFSSLSCRTSSNHPRPFFSCIFLLLRWTTSFIFHSKIVIYSLVFSPFGLLRELKREIEIQCRFFKRCMRKSFKNIYLGSNFFSLYSKIILDLWNPWR